MSIGVILYSFLVTMRLKLNKTDSVSHYYTLVLQDIIYALYIYVSSSHTLSFKTPLEGYSISDIGENSCDGNYLAIN